MRTVTTLLDMLSLSTPISAQTVLSEAVLLLSATAPFIIYFFSSDDSDTLTVTVEIVDRLVGKTYPHAGRVVARRQSGGLADRTIIDLIKGEGEAELEEGDWAFEVVEKSRTIGQREHTLKSGNESYHLVLTVDPYIVEATVTGGPNREPLEQAAVEVTTDAGEWKMDKTDSGGKVQFELPRSASTVSFTATYGDLPPIESEYQIEEAAQDGVNLAIAGGTGTMRVETTVGNRMWPEADVQIAPDSKGAKTYADAGTITTDYQGRQTIERVPVGEYELSAHPRVDGVETTAATRLVRITADETVDVTLSIGIRYSLSDARRQRLEDLRGRIASLSDHSDRDVAVPLYYGTVLIAVLELVEAIAVAPERAGRAEIAPDAAVDALLDATEMGLDIVTDVMSERRVVSIFKACEPIPPAEVTWRGVTTLAGFFDRVNAGAKSERRVLSDRLQAVGEVLDQQWDEVNDLAPAQKVHGRVGKLAQESPPDDELTTVARTYVGLCLLDAVESIFDHDELVDRLNSRTL